MKTPRRNSKRSKACIRTRAKIIRKNHRFRLSVFRSSRYIYCQIIDDIDNKTIISCNEKELDDISKKKLTKTEKARLLGTLVAQKAKKEKINKIVFDRGGYKFHGRIKALAQAAREGGMQF